MLRYISRWLLLAAALVGPGIAWATCPSGSTCTAVDALPAGSSIGGTNLTICDQSSTTYSCTYAQVLSYIEANLGTFATQNYATPPAIGGTTPAAGAFTTLSASSTVSGSGFSTYLASPPAIGGTAAAGGAFTTLSASSTVSGSGFSTYLASPPAIGGTAAAAGSFTALSASGAVTFSGLGSGTQTECLGLTSGNAVVPSTGACGSGGSSVTLQTNSTNNSSQTTLNLESGGGITVANPSSGNVTITASYTPRVVTGATDTILDTDCGNYVMYTDAASVAVTLPQATGNFAACSVDVVVPAGDGPVTVTPTTSTINGASTLVVNGGKFATITADSGNYDAIGTAVGSITQTIASGTAALGTSAIASGACASAVTVAASGVLTTDTVNAGFNSDPTSTVGFEPSTSGMLTIVAYPTANDVNFKVCNDTSASVTPGSVTLNWRVVR